MAIVATRQSVYDRTRTLKAQTPFLAVDTGRVIDSYHRLLSSVPRAEIFYAVKANSHIAVLKALAEQGSSFDVASLNELEKVLGMGICPDRIIGSNPIKNEAFLRRSAAAGIYAVVADSVDEVRKIARFAPGMRVYIRLAVDNSGAVFPLDKKFGASAEQAIDQLILARGLGLEPIGLAFHVGSQCVRADNWIMAIQSCGDIWREAQAHGIHLNFLDMGGGYPIRTDPSVPTFEEIGEAIDAAIAEFIPPTPDLRVIMEPGRAMVGECGVMALSIVGRAERGNKTWLYLDSGVFNGLGEILEGSSYPVVTEDPDQPATHVYTLAGPSCDSFDTIMRDVELPEVNIGDRLYFLFTGAYTTEYGSRFNGFDIPEIEILD